MVVFSVIDLESVRMFCNIRNTTIKQMEKDLGIGNGVIAKWAKRGTDPSYERIVQIARYLDCTPPEITFGHRQPGEIEGITEKEKTLLEAFRSLTAAQQDFVLRQLSGAAPSPEAPAADE